MELYDTYAVFFPILTNLISRFCNLGFVIFCTVKNDQRTDKFRARINI